MTAQEFKKELEKIMPGYKWTVHRKILDHTLSATGIQSSGSNRTSTLHVERHERDGFVKYVTKSSGYGAKAPWLSESSDTTLARALRSLQNDYERMAAEYGCHAKALQNARKVTAGEIDG